MSKNTDFLFFLRSPRLDNLVRLTLDVDFSISVKPQSMYHRKILKCRQLIFTMPYLLATPELQQENQIVIIISKIHSKLEEFCHKLLSMGLQVSKMQDVSYEDLQSCLRYTVIAKMAPSWNMVGDCLVHGRDFLTSKEPLKSVSFQLVVSEGEIHLSLNAYSVRMPEMKLIDYMTSDEFDAWEKDTPYIKGLKPLYVPVEDDCFVLPSMTKAKLLSITNFIPSQSCFKDYNEIKKHWKNMYGYRLPEETCMQLYCNVRFRIKKGIEYTYPMICVRPNSAIISPLMDYKNTLEVFLSDLRHKVGNICGTNCEFLDLKPSFPSLEVFPAGDVTEEMNPRCGTTFYRTDATSARPIKKNVSFNPELASSQTPTTNDCFTRGSSGSSQNEAVFSAKCATKSLFAPTLSQPLTQDGTQPLPSWLLSCQSRSVPHPFPIRTPPPRLFPNVVRLGKLSPESRMKGRRSICSGKLAARVVLNVPEPRKPVATPRQSTLKSYLLDKAKTLSSFRVPPSNVPHTQSKERRPVPKVSDFGPSKGSNKFSLVWKDDAVTKQERDDSSDRKRKQNPNEDNDGPEAKRFSESAELVAETPSNQWATDDANDSGSACPSRDGDSVGGEVCSFVGEVAQSRFFSSMEERVSPEVPPVQSDEVNQPSQVDSASPNSEQGSQATLASKRIDTELQISELRVDESLAMPCQDSEPKEEAGSAETTTLSNQEHGHAGASATTTSRKPKPIASVSSTAATAPRSFTDLATSDIVFPTGTNGFHAPKVVPDFFRRKSGLTTGKAQPPKARIIPQFFQKTKRLENPESKAGERRSPNFLAKSVPRPGSEKKNRNSRKEEKKAPKEKDRIQKFFTGKNRYLQK